MAKKHRPSSGIILAAALIFLALLAWLFDLPWKLEGDGWVVDGFDDLRNVFLIVAGCVGGGFVYWRTSIASTDAETKKQNGINNMYTIAIEQLGKEHEKGRPNLEVRIGALYSLEKLAQANADYRQSIMDVLCSYVRNNAPLPRNRESPEESEYASQNKDKPRTDIQTALTIIGRSNTEAADKVLPIDLSNCHLVGADLRKADLQEANLQEANLQEVMLQEANLQRAKLREANLQGAVLYEAYLRGANLWWADLRGANLQRAILRTANLEGVNLRWANLQKANLQRAILRTANLEGAYLQGVDLRACWGIKYKQLQEARGWQQAYRDPELACGADIPDPSEKDKKEAEQKDKDA